METFTVEERREIYYEALCSFKVGSGNFICNYLQNVSRIMATKEVFPEFFLFKEMGGLAWLSHQIDECCNMSDAEISETKVLVMGLCIAMCE